MTFWGGNKHEPDIWDCLYCGIRCDPGYEHDDGYFLDTAPRQWACTECAHAHVCHDCGEYTAERQDEFGPEVLYRNPLTDGDPGARPVPAHALCAGLELTSLARGDCFYDDYTKDEITAAMAGEKVEA